MSVELMKKRKFRSEIKGKEKGKKIKTRKMCNNNKYNDGYIFGLR